MNILAVDGKPVPDGANVRLDKDMTRQEIMAFWTVDYVERAAGLSFFEDDLARYALKHNFSTRLENGRTAYPAAVYLGVTNSEEYSDMLYALLEGKPTTGDNGGSAFPPCGGGDGMTLRDSLAVTAALEVLRLTRMDSSRAMFRLEAAEEAYKIADALLEERNKRRNYVF